MYGTGRGVPQDDAEAVKWYRLAAAQGSALGQYNLGVRYYNGEGVPQDYVQAYKWFNLAAATSTEKEARDRAVEARDLVAARMTAAQIAEAQKLAREWKKQ
jgi:TPR repeat protein